MSAKVAIPGVWKLESQPMSSGMSKSAQLYHERFDPRERKERHYYDILSSDSESGGEADEFGDDLFPEDVGDFLVKSSLGATGIERNIAAGARSASSLPIEILPKTEDASRILRQRSRRSAAEQSRDEAWERRRLIEEMKSSDPSRRTIARSISDCGQQQSRSGESDLVPVEECARTRSLTEEDFEELRGCIDLGFRFGDKEDPILCNTLPALEVCYAVNRQLQDLQQGCSSPSSASSDSCSSWKVASPGDEVQQVKEKLKHWARAVACISRQSY